MRRLLALCFAFTIVVAGATSAGAASPRWRLQTVPMVSGWPPTLNGVSCPTTSVCAAVGYVEFFDTNGNDHVNAAVERFQNGTWSVQNLPLPAGESTSMLDGVSCPTTTTCTAVGVGSDANGFHALIERYSAGIWKIQTGATLAGTAWLRSVSCTSLTMCTAVGEKAPISNSNATTPLVERWTGGVWKTQQSVPATSAATWNSVSCTSAASCVAVGGQSDGVRGLAARWNGTKWTSLSVPKQVAAMSSVSCPTAQVCTAVNVNSAVRWAGHGPTVSQIPMPARVSDIGAQNVSCPTTTICQVAGFIVDEQGHRHVNAARLSGGHWVLQAPPDEALDSWLYAVACPSASVCEAVGTQDSEGLAYRYS